MTASTAIVTGAASGIGREIARQMAARGTFVLVTDLDQAAVDDVAAGIREEGGNATGRALDVSDSSQIEAAVKAVTDEHGSLGYMFNNAGVAIFGEVEEVSLEEWDKIIDVNLRGVAHGTTIAYRQMIKQGGGHIVNTASAAGLVPVPLQAHYCATKHGVVGLSKTLAIEARPKGVRVTVFCPGFVDTGMVENNTLHGSMKGANARKLVPVNPITPEQAVKRMLRGVDRGKQMVVTPWYGQLGWRLERFSPALAGRVHTMSLGELRKRSRKHKLPV